MISRVKENLTTLDVYAPKNRVSKTTEQNLIASQEK